MKPVQLNAQGLKANENKQGNLLGQTHALLEQIGAYEPFTVADALGKTVRLHEVKDPCALSVFLQAYADQILKPLELALVIRAYNHTVRGEARELIQLDQDASCMPGMAVFAGASRKVGRDRLESLRPLRDHRVAKRYLAALDSGSAEGWHPIVFGLILAIYSIPPRQGLFHYGEVTLSGLAQSVCRAKHFSVPDCSEIVEPALSALPEGIEKAMALVS